MAWWFRLYFASAIVAAGVHAAAQPHPADFAAFYRITYGEVTAASPSGELVSAAERIFDAVAAVADRRAGRPLRLLVAEIPERPEALALPDGTVVVNPALLRFCLRGPGVSPERGEARLAFVLGHEIAHLAHDDAWHAQAFAAVQRYGDPDLAEATRGWSLEPVATRHEKEVRADAVGFLYLLRAGFSPDGVLGAGEADFLNEWERLKEDAVGSDPAHPPFATRARFLRAQLAEIVEDLPYFRFGVRLLTLGRHDEAIALLEHFQARFPGREVGADLGLAYYRRGLARLGECGLADALRYRLTTLVEPESLVARVRLRGEPEPGCRRRAREDLEEARRILQETYDQDPERRSTRLNLTAVLIALGRGHEAYGVATGSAARGERPSGPLDPRLAVAAAVALYEAGDEWPVSTTDEALRALRDLEGRLGPEERETRAAAAFNRARILQQAGRAAAARAAWEAFLALEPAGPWADEARLALLGGARSGGEGARNSPAPRKPTLAGRLPPPLKGRLDRCSRRPFAAGELRGAFLEGDDLAALELAGSLVLVEETLRPPLAAAGVPGLDRPRAVVEAEGGRRTVLLENLAHDVEGDRVVARTWFEPR